MRNFEAITNAIFGNLMNRKNHWETIYETKSIQEFSWYQAVPETSLDVMLELNLPFQPYRTRHFFRSPTSSSTKAG